MTLEIKKEITKRRSYNNEKKGNNKTMKKTTGSMTSFMQSKMLK